MKKLLLFLALGISLCANAQLTVYEDGQVRIGNYSTNILPSISTLDISYQNLNNPALSPSGCITMGGGTGASISGSNRSGVLSLYGSKYIYFGVGNQPTIVNLNSLNQSLTSLYPIGAPSFLTTSDARLKTSVEYISDSFGKLMDVDAVSYKLVKPQSKNTESMDFSNSEDEAEKAADLGDTRIHFGFIAQEIQKIYPNLVVEDEDGMLAIDYAGFIPLLVEAYKDLVGRVQQQQELIEALLAQKGPSHISASVTGLADSKATLKQNSPNPFNTITTIECYVPQSIASAFICLYDLQGKQVLRKDIGERGNVVVTIEGVSLTPGIYIYALMADGTEVDSKRMIITDR